MKGGFAAVLGLLMPGLAIGQGLPEALSPVPAAEAEDTQDVIAAPVVAQGIVGRVDITGLVRVEPAAVLAAIDLHDGDTLTPEAIAEDIRSVWASGFVDDVVVHIEPMDDSDQVVLRFEVEENDDSRNLIDGNKKIDDEGLNEVIDIVPFSVLNDAEVKRNVDRIREKYIEKGFYLVEVEPQVREVGDQLVQLTFDVTEHKKVLVQTVDITGNDNIPDRKIRRFLQTKQAGIVPWLTSSGTFNEMALEADLQIIRSVFLEEGYVDVQVDPPQVYLSPDKRFIYITVNVTEGPRFMLGALKSQGYFVLEVGLTQEAVFQIVEGRTAKVMSVRWTQALAKSPEGETPEGWETGGRTFLRFDPDHPPMTEGDWFKLTDLQLTMTEIGDLYGDQGYAFANVVPITETDPETGIVDITFDIQKGQKVSIARIDITGNDPTYDKVIRREIPINEGDVYSGSALAEARQRIERLGYFEEVRISTPKGAKPDTLDMKVDVVEQPTGSFSVGAGFSNIENFMLTANISKNNFLGLGYIMSAAANISQLRQQGNLQLYDPYFLDSRWTLRVDGYSIARQYIENEYQRGGSIAVGRYLDARDDMRLVFDYTVEDTGLESLDAYKEQLLGGQLYRNGLTSTGGLSVIVDKRNNRIQATRGVYATASANLSGGIRRGDTEELMSIFGGEFNFYELKANFRAFYPLVEKEWLIFKYNGTLGRIQSTDGTVVPYIHRYRAGGINSVRGYNWFSLGPFIRASGYEGSSSNLFVGSDDPTSAEDRLVVGGTQTWINNFELEVPIVKQAGISTVVFFDAGNAFGDPWGEGSINPTLLRMSYGFGVRWFSPMGPLRFEWGFPIKPNPDERPAVFDFSIGSLF